MHLGRCETICLQVLIVAGSSHAPGSRAVGRDLLLGDIAADTVVISGTVEPGMLGGLLLTNQVGQS